MLMVGLQGHTASASADEYSRGAQAAWFVPCRSRVLAVHLHGVSVLGYFDFTARFLYNAC